MAKRASAAETSNKRNVVNVPLSPRANKALNMWLDRSPGKKTQLVVGAFISGIWLIVKLCTMPKCKTIDEIIDQLKSTAVETDQQSESEPGRQQTT